jgi:hypothetical protein
MKACCETILGYLIEFDLDELKRTGDRQSIPCAIVTEDGRRSEPFHFPAGHVRACISTFGLRQSPPVAPASYKVEVVADDSGEWCGNELRFALKDEAEAYAADLSGRWLAVRAWRVVGSDDPVNRPAGGRDGGQAPR